MPVAPRRTASRGSPSRAGAEGDTRVSAPQLFEAASAGLLDRRVRESLAILGPELAQRVGRHLAAAGLLLEDDPGAAVEHARYARQRAARLPEVREALGVAAYAAGDYALARAELRTVRRMTGSGAMLPLLADCERALGRPAEAIALAKDPAAARLDPADQIELRLVAAGARLDLGEPEQALRLLEVPELAAGDEEATGPVLRLWYVRAEALLAAGRRTEALDVFDRIASLDEDLTDAADRADALHSR